MGAYLTRDIETDDGGELQFENGDLKVASVKRSALQVLNWVIASNRGDTIHGDAVGDLGAWFGRLNIPRNHRAMEEQIRRALLVQGYFSPGDVRVGVVPVGLNEAAVTARLFGNFLEPSADLEEEGYAVLGYVFPFGTAQLRRVES